jgi:lipid-A-disaccharide synthase
MLPVKYYLIAGEASGDLHGANLIKALRTLDTQAECRAWGGDLMQDAGAEVVKHYRELAFMGFVEVVANLRTILRNIARCKEDITSFKPDVLVLIDYPGFNMRIAEWAKQQGIRVVYYISPQIWAWKQKRGYKLKRDVDLMLCILPFEQAFYKRFDMEVKYVGHPLLDAIENRPEVHREERLAAYGLHAEKPLLLLLPGSRKQEIKSMLPIMLKAAAKMETHQVAIAGAPSQTADFYTEVVRNNQVPVLFGETYNLLEVADVALVTSGTATLETALFKVPEVVCYKASTISYYIARQLVKVPYISLVNLIADKELVKELIQHDMNPRKLVSELEKLMGEENPHRKALLRDYQALAEKLGGGGASMRAAEHIQNLLRT